jgi:hypothetical protein
MDKRILPFLTILAISLFFTTCKENSTSAGPDNAGAEFINDYFPVSSSYRWSYISNAFSVKGETYSLVDMKIDTAKFHGSIRPSLKIRPAGTTEWKAIYGLLDSGNFIYILQDIPPAAMYPLFQHSYDSSYGARESVALSGMRYDAVKITIPLVDETLYYMWFVKGVGLIKDSSGTGFSLFSSANTKYNVVIQSNLTFVGK